MDSEKIKASLLGAAGGAIVMVVVGFSWGGWVTGSTARELAGVAVVDRLAPICVERFNRDSEKTRKLAVLKEKGAWEGPRYIEKQGWATMLGEKAPDTDVAEKCAELLMQTA